MGLYQEKYCNLLQVLSGLHDMTGPANLTELGHADVKTSNYQRSPATHKVRRKSPESWTNGVAIMPNLAGQNLEEQGLYIVMRADGTRTHDNRYHNPWLDEAKISYLAKKAQESYLVFWIVFFVFVDLCKYAAVEFKLRDGNHLETTLIVPTEQLFYQISTVGYGEGITNRTSGSKIGLVSAEQV